MVDLRSRSVDSPVTSVPEPCVPSHISTQYTLSIGQVSWDPSAGASHYAVTGVTSQGMTVGCETSDTFCPMLGMACSQMYNVSVTAHNSACSTTSLESVAIQTGEWTPTFFSLPLMTMCHVQKSPVENIACRLHLQNPVRPTTWAPRWTVKDWRPL